MSGPIAGLFVMRLPPSPAFVTMRAARSGNISRDTRRGSCGIALLALLEFVEAETRYVSDAAAREVVVYVVRHEQAAILRHDRERLAPFFGRAVANDLGEVVSRSFFIRHGLCMT